MLWSAAAIADNVASAPKPHILVISVDTLRADHLSGYGYSRPTSPNIDRLFVEKGAKFTAARAVQPLTTPSMASMWTSLPPQKHGATRNNVRLRRRLVSLSKLLRREGWQTSGFISNWVLKDKLSGLGEHFEHFEGIFSRKQWIFFRDEARADDVTDAALDYLNDVVDGDDKRPILMWVHYIDPHRPYDTHEEFFEPLGIVGPTNRVDRYDTEVAYTDREIGRFVDEALKKLPAEDTLIVFTSDHGEGLGQHGETEHGHHLFETTLNVPLVFVWPGRISPQTIEASASLLDIAPTVLDLVDISIPEDFVGFSWEPIFEGGEAPTARVTFHQAHKRETLGASRDSEVEPVRDGLLAISIVNDGRKEVFYTRKGDKMAFDLLGDPAEVRNLIVDEDDPLSDELLQWMAEIYGDLDALGNLPVRKLDAESIEQLRTLGYVD